MYHDTRRHRPDTRIWASLSFAGFIAVVLVNALANILPINGVNTGTLSDEIPNLFVPAGLTFSIWGLIYLMLAGYCVALMADAFGNRDNKRWTVVEGRLFTLNMAANVAWVFAWHYRLVPLSLVLMLVILSTLIALAERNWNRITASSRRGGSRSREELDAFADFFLAAPISVYFGWICVATIANVTAVLVSAGWDGFGIDPRLWTVAAIAAGAAVAILLVVSRRAVAAPLVVVWAYAGIVIKRRSVDTENSTAVWIAALAAAVLVVLVLILVHFGNPARRSIGGGSQRK